MANGRDSVVLGSVLTMFGTGTSLGMDDDELIERFLTKRGEVAEAAFQTLVARHGPMVLGVCRGILRDSHDAQDAFQATFLVLARRAGSIRRRDSLTSWLYGVARKIALRTRSDAARRRAREHEAALLAMAEPRPGREPEDLSVLYEEIDRLPGTYRRPIILCYLDGMTYEAAAAQLNCPLGTLSVRLHRARERLRSRLTRRGVAVPAGLLVASLTPSVAPAAVPIALAKLAARSSLAWSLKQATVSGTVSASVVSLAERMMTTMRLKSLAVGLLALSGVMLAASGTLAMKPAPTEQTSPQPQPQPKAKEPRSWVRTFPGGTTVELLGISTHPSNPGSWRTPDGAPLATPPYHHASYRATTGPQQQVWEVAYRVQNQPRGEKSPQLQTVPLSSSPGSSPGFDSMGLPVPEIYSNSIVFPKDQSSCATRFGWATGRWKTESTGNGRDIVGIGREKGSAIFGTALEVGPKTFITVGVADSEDDRSVVAVDLKSMEHGPSRMQSVGVKNFYQLELQYNLPLAEIKEFRLQLSPYEWVSFDDVTLKPRGESDSPTK